MTLPPRLFIDRIDADFRQGVDLALGPWCHVSVENLVPDWEETTFPDPFPTVEDWVAAECLTRRLAESLVPAWAERFNKCHGRSYSLKFWRVFLLNWLTVAVPALWSRYRWCQEFVSLHAEKNLTLTLMGGGDTWPLTQSGDLLPLLWCPTFDARLSSLVLRTMLPSSWQINESADPPVSPSAPVELIIPAESWRGRLARSLLGRLPFAHVPGTGVARLPMSAILALLPRRMPGLDGLTFPDVTEAFPSEFLRLLDEFLPQVVPATFTRDFLRLEAIAQKQHYHPGRLLVDTLNSEDDSIRVVTAMAYERGERLVGSQHGGTYGTHRAMMASAATEYPYHAFLTWGWDRHDDFVGNFVPVPSPMLGKLADCHRETQPALIFVGGSMVVHGTRLGWLPKPQHYLSYRRAKLDFINSLADPVRIALSYRPYRRNVTILEDDGFIHRHHPDIPLVEGDLSRAILGCRLLVLDHPITTMLVAMAANIPTIMYWEEDAWPLAISASPYFQALRDAGILFHDPQAAAAQVNAIWNDVPGWWRSASIQQARRHFAHHFARTSRWWWIYWLAALWRLSRQGGN